MKKTFFTIGFLFLALSSAAFAQSAQDPACRLVASHKPSNDANYRPGLDVRGKPVVPADLNAAPPMLPETIVVPLTIDLAQRLDGQGVKGLTLDGNAGYLEINPSTGSVRWNDQDITPAMAVLCDQNPDAGDGQDGANVIKSEPIPSQTAE
jgi:hypothetical protein